MVDIITITRLDGLSIYSSPGSYMIECLCYDCSGFGGVGI